MRARHRFGSITLADLGRQLSQYKGLAIAVLLVVLIVQLFPGEMAPKVSEISEGGAFGAERGADGAVPTEGGALAGRGASGRRSAGGLANVAGKGAGPTALSAATDPNCDPATGRIRVPSVYAPPCRPFSGSNGGATSQGVTKDKIRLVFYYYYDPASDALLTSLGISDRIEDVIRAVRQYMELYGAHYQFYGRKVEVVPVEASGTDDQAQRADAIKIATELKPFAVLAFFVGDPFATELAARRVVVFPVNGKSRYFYAKYAPYIWNGEPMDSEQALTHMAEYIGKRLWTKKARWAGDPVFQTRARTLGLIGPEGANGEEQRDADFFSRELAKYGARLATRVFYAPDASRGQEQSRTVIAKLREAKVTTVVQVGDPVGTIFLTKEATNQGYSPEWFFGGRQGIDAAFWGRLFDQQQWRHAFGIGHIFRGMPKALWEPWRLYKWHFGRDPDFQTGNILNQYGLRMVATAIHMAGPNLTPQTFRLGLFAYPPSGGGVSNYLLAWGRQLWGWDDYSQPDDSFETWYGPETVGEDEFGQSAPGMYGYVNNTKRYRVGQWPTTEPQVFDSSKAVFWYDELPAQDRPPAYEHKPH